MSGFSLDDILAATAAQAQPEEEAPAPPRKAPEPASEPQPGILDYLLAQPAPVAPEAPQRVAVADPYGLGTYQAPEARPTIPVAPEEAQPDPVLGSAQVQASALTDQMRQMFTTPIAKMEPEMARRLTLRASGYRQVKGVGGCVTVAGLARPGDRVEVERDGARSYVTLGRQVQPGVYAIADDHPDQQGATGKVCPGNNNCRRYGWAPGTSSCRGWHGRRD